MPRLTVTRALVPSHSEVDDAAEHAHYWQELMRAWGAPLRNVHRPHYFPGCHPCSLSRSSVTSLGRSPYLVTLKSDGVRYALFLTTRPGKDRAPVALMVDRSRHMYEVEVIAPEAYFTRGTVLEGELVWRQPDEQQLVFLVFDAVRVSGELVTAHTFAQRLDAVERCTRFSVEIAALDAADAENRVLEVDAIALTHFAPHVDMRPKQFVDRAHAAQLWHARSGAEHRVDGLVLQRADAPYCFGTSRGGAALKWKERVTVDLVGEADALRAADGPITSALEGRQLVVAPSRIVGSGDTVVEYHVRVTKATVTLFALRTRPDKTTANGLTVVSAAVRDVVEAITPEEVGGA